MANEATAIIMEDLQWADRRASGSSITCWVALQASAGRDGARAPGVLERQFEPLRRARPRAARAPADQQALARTIARSLLGDDTDDEVVERIAQQAAGLPLFAEELARLTAAGRDAGRAPTIQAAIQVSLDSLDDECRDAVGRLSVLGLTCWDSALEALGMTRAESVMKALGAAEIVMEQNVSRFPGTREWVIKHALVREVAYSSLGERERKELHGLAAESRLHARTPPRWPDPMTGRPARAGRRTLGARRAEVALATNALHRRAQHGRARAEFAGSEGDFSARRTDEAYSRLDPRCQRAGNGAPCAMGELYVHSCGALARGARARYEDRGSGVASSNAGADP